MTDPQGPGSSWSPSGNPPSDPDVTRLPGAAPGPGQYGAPQYPGYPQGQYPGTGEGQYPGTGEGQYPSQYPQQYGDPQQQYGAPQQYGAAPQYGDPQYGDPQYGQYPAQPAYPATQQYPDQQQYGTPSYGGPPAYGTESYGGAPSYGAPQYGAPYGSGGHPAPGYSSGGYGQQGHYPQGAYGSPPPRSGNRTWILVAALVAVLAVAGGVITVILLNRDGGGGGEAAGGGAVVAPPVIAQGSSSPGAEIPDDDPVGLTDTITLDGGSGTVGRLDVSVRFEHRYPSEITGVLTAPSGRQATIIAEDRETSVRLSSADPASPLQGLLGGPITGAWRLTLTDDTAIDAGRLVSWDITATPGTGGAAPAPAPAPAPGPAGAPLTGSSSPGITVPNDDDTGITDTIVLQGEGTVERVQVTVDLPHRAPADLVLQLRAPSGQTVTLADHERDTTFSYSSTSGTELADLAGTPAAGPWTLVAIDDIVLDEGVLESWQITVNG